MYLVAPAVILLGILWAVAVLDVIQILFERILKK